MKKSVIKWAFGSSLTIILLGTLMLTVFDLDDFLPTSVLFRRFGLELPRGATEVVVNDEEDAMVISFRLDRQDAERFVGQSIADYAGWRQQRPGEVFPSLGNVPDSGLKNLMVNEKRNGKSTWRLLSDTSTGECIAYFDRG